MLSDNVHAIDLVSLLYVSRSLIQEGDAEAQLGDIVSVALARNQSLQVTGALLFTGAYFAQALEGPRRAVTELMDKIERDPRHRDVSTVSLGPLRTRLFPDWAMAYSGPSPYFDRHVKPLLSPFTADEQKNDLVESLLDELRSVRPSRLTG